MNTKLREDYTPAALYARVSSDRQDVVLSVAAQMRALRDYAPEVGWQQKGDDPRLIPAHPFKTNQSRDRQEWLTWNTVPR